MAEQQGPVSKNNGKVTQAKSLLNTNQKEITLCTDCRWLPMAFSSFSKLFPQLPWTRPVGSMFSHCLDFYAVIFLTQSSFPYVFTEFSKICDKNNIIKKKDCRIRTYYFLYKKPVVILSASKAQVTEKIFKLTTFHALVIFHIPWIRWIQRISVPFRETSVGLMTHSWSRFFLCNFEMH